MEATAAGAGLAAFSPGAGEAAEDKPAPALGPPPGILQRFSPPLAVSTWKHGLPASRAAMSILQVGGSPLDAVEKGINVVETDPSVDSVGVGGNPNEEGEVELDAAIMDGDLRCGSVMALRQIATPISVARRVMERTRHIQLVGDGALQFALEEKFPLADLLTPQSRARWEEWRRSPDRRVPGQVEEKAPPAVPPPEKGPPEKRPPEKAPEKQPPEKRVPEKGAAAERPGGGAHDTVATLAISASGLMAAGCSTSGLSWKLPGRVGDSPIIGAGLYCDGEVGAAGATGIGEEILRVCGSFLIVEGMRRGLDPHKAIAEALRRILRADPRNRQRQVAFIALSRAGEVGAGALQPGFQAAVVTANGRQLLLDVPAFAG